MAFNIVLYQNNSEPNRIGKDLTEIATVSGVLRDATSILTPRIAIEGDISDVTGCNYFYIAEFGRYYYITDIQSLRHNLYDISGRVDVLETYKEQIKANTALVFRQENAWNLYLNDGSFKTFQNPIVLTKEFPSGFSSLSYILAVAGGA